MPAHHGQQFSVVHRDHRVHRISVERCSWPTNKRQPTVAALQRIASAQAVNLDDLA